MEAPGKPNREKRALTIHRHVAVHSSREIKTRSPNANARKMEGSKAMPCESVDGIENKSPRPTTNLPKAAHRLFSIEWIATLVVTNQINRSRAA